MDAIFNNFGSSVGYMATFGISTSPGLEMHSRFGNSFTFSVNELMQRIIKW